jgi:hypothetical protein
LIVLSFLALRGRQREREREREREEAAVSITHLIERRKNG